MRKRYDFVSESEENVDSAECWCAKNNIHDVPFYVGIVILIFLGLMYGLVYLHDSNLPTPLTVVDEKNYPDSFISERAIQDLQALTNIGPRITGSYENEMLAVDFLRRKINFIIQQSNQNQKIELDVQVVSGAFTLEARLVYQINSYSNVQNVIVKLFGKNDSVNSILVNSHFDSVPTSPGGSDPTNTKVWLFTGPVLGLDFL